jgi:pectinesterase
MHYSRRRLLERLATFPVVANVGCSSLSERPLRAPLHTQSAVVSATYTGAIGELRDGIPHFRSLEQALQAAPLDSSTPWRIVVRPGRYREKLNVVKPNIHLIGTSQDDCVISFDAYSGQTRPDGVGTWTTFGCATLTVKAPGFAASNLTIENSFDYLSNDAKPPTDPTYTNDPQAVALMLAKGSDRAQLRNVSITGYQDTLFVDAGRSYFCDCRISGNVDFIFGAGQAVFEMCDVVSRPRRKPNVSPHGYITAPSTQLRDSHGLLLLRCKLLRESALVPANSHALGRPWHPAVTFADGRYADPNAVGSSVFIECIMDDHITQDGWWSMTGLQKSGASRTVFYPEDSRFFEYRCYGPGAAKAGNAKRRQLSESDASRYTVTQAFADWQP